VPVYDEQGVEIPYNDTIVVLKDSLITKNSLSPVRFFAGAKI
jgi:hypothetical protein